MSFCRSLVVPRRSDGVAEEEELTAERLLVFWSPDLEGVQLYVSVSLSL